MVDKVGSDQLARIPNLKIDGELQADAAIVLRRGAKPRIAKRRKANVLVSLTLVGNIAYKVQRLAGRRNL